MSKKTDKQGIDDWALVEERYSKADTGLNLFIANLALLRASADAETGQDATDIETQIALLKAKIDTNLSAINTGLASTYAEA